MKTFKEFKESTADRVLHLKLMTKALKTMPSSPKQKEIIKQINVVRKRLKLKPLEEDVRKMPDGRYGVYADKFKNKKRVMTPGGKHAKELKKVYKNKKDANDYMAAIMIAKGG